MRSETSGRLVKTYSSSGSDLWSGWQFISRIDLIVSVEHRYDAALMRVCDGETGRSIMRRPKHGNWGRCISWRWYCGQLIQLSEMITARNTTPGRNSLEPASFAPQRHRAVHEEHHSRSVNGRSRPTSRDGQTHRNRQHA